MANSSNALIQEFRRNKNVRGTSLECRSLVFQLCELDTTFRLSDIVMYSLGDSAPKEAVDWLEKRATRRKIARLNVYTNRLANRSRWGTSSSRLSHVDDQGRVASR